MDFSGYWSLIFKLTRKTFFEPFLNVAIHLGWILSIFYIRTHISINVKYNKTEVSTISMFWWFSSVLGFLIQPVYSSDERSQSISLDDSGIPLSNVNIHRVSPNCCNLVAIYHHLQGYLSIAVTQMHARAIVSLYYSNNAIYT